MRVFNVRGNSTHPGLNAEDLTLAKALALACGGTFSGDFGAHELLFSPGLRPIGLNERIEPEEAAGDGHANALVVLLALMPVMARSGVFSKITAQGETFGHNVLSYDYFVNATLAAHRRMGLYAYPELSLAGFGKGSRGEVRLEIEPSQLQGLEWDARGSLVSCCAVVATGELSPEVAGRGAAHLKRLAQGSKVPLQVEVFDVRSRQSGAFVTVLAEYENGVGGATAMGRRGLRIESVAQNAFDAFLQWNSGPWTADSFLADQILVTAAFALSDTIFTVPKITPRLMTVAWVVKQFLPIRLTIRGDEGSEGVVTIRR
jgi:RNA 3'-terminal phosphate cyclase (ATP)